MFLIAAKTGNIPDPSETRGTTSRKVSDVNPNSASELPSDPVFLLGGPVRILLHILLKCINLNCTE